jgi:hypothetical protein
MIVAWGGLVVALFVTATRRRNWAITVSVTVIPNSDFTGPDTKMARMTRAIFVLGAAPGGNTSHPLRGL